MKRFILVVAIILAVFFVFDYIQNKPERGSYTKRVPVSSEGKSEKTIGQKVLIISRRGEVIFPDRETVRGGVTLFLFYADWCRGCKQMTPQLEEYVYATDGVYLRKINIKDWNSPVVKKYRIPAVPSIWIYDRNGKISDKNLTNMGKIKTIVEELLFNAG